MANFGVPSTITTTTSTGFSFSSMPTMSSTGGFACQTSQSAPNTGLNFPVAPAATTTGGGGFNFGQSGGGSGFSFGLPPSLTSSSSGFFSSVPQSTSFNAIPQSTGFGLAPQSTTFSLVPQNTSFSSSPQSAAFSLPSQSTAFSLPSQSTAFSLPSQSTAFSLPSQSTAFSLPSQSSSFSLAPQSTSFGLAPQHSFAPGGFNFSTVAPVSSTGLTLGSGTSGFSFMSPTTTASSGGSGGFSFSSVATSPEMSTSNLSLMSPIASTALSGGSGGFSFGSLTTTSGMTSASGFGFLSPTSSSGITAPLTSIGIGNFGFGVGTSNTTVPNSSFSFAAPSSQPLSLSGGLTTASTSHGMNFGNILPTNASSTGLNSSAVPSGMTFATITSPTITSSTAATAVGFGISSPTSPVSLAGFTYTPTFSQPATSVQIPNSGGFLFVTGLSGTSTSVSSSDAGTVTTASSGFNFGLSTTSSGLSVLPQTCASSGFTNLITTQAATTTSGAFSFGVPASTSTGFSFGSTTSAPSSAGFAFGLTSAASTPSASLTLSLSTPSTVTSTTTSGFGIGLTPLSSTAATSPFTGFSLTSASTSIPSASLGLGNSSQFTTISSAPSLSIGLGGTQPPVSTSLGIATDAKLDGKSIKEIPLPQEFCSTIEMFENYKNAEKLSSEDNNRQTDGAFQKLGDDTRKLKQHVLQLSNQYSQLQVVSDRLKRRVMEEAEHVEMARRTQDTPMSLQGNNKAPEQYFLKLVHSFEERMRFCRAKIDEVEACNSASSVSRQSADDVNEVLRREHDAMKVLAAKAYVVHNKLIDLCEKASTSVTKPEALFKAHTKESFSNPSPSSVLRPCLGDGGSGLMLFQAGQERAKAVSLAAAPPTLSLNQSLQPSFNIGNFNTGSGLFGSGSQNTSFNNPSTGFGTSALGMSFGSNTSSFGNQSNPLFISSEPTVRDEEIRRKRRI